MDVMEQCCEVFSKKIFPLNRFQGWNLFDCYDVIRLKAFDGGFFGFLIDTSLAPVPFSPFYNGFRHSAENVCA